MTVVEMIDPQRIVLIEIADKHLTRDDVAITYAYCLRQGEVDRIGEINKAIIERWSLSALKYIKTKAWKRIGEK